MLSVLVENRAEVHSGCLGDGDDQDGRPGVVIFALF